MGHAVFALGIAGLIALGIGGGVLLPSIGVAIRTVAVATLELGGFLAVCQGVAILVVVLVMRERSDTKDGKAAAATL